MSSAPQLERHLSEIDRAGPERILIDFSNLEFIDSTGLALMINAQEAAEANGHELYLRLGSDQIAAGAAAEVVAIALSLPRLHLFVQIPRQTSEGRAGGGSRGSATLSAPVHGHGSRS